MSSTIEVNAIKEAVEARQMALEWERRYRELMREHTALKTLHAKCVRILAEGA